MQREPMICTCAELIELGFKKETIGDSRYWKRTSDGRLIVPAKKVAEVRLRMAQKSGDTVYQRLNKADTQRSLGYTYLFARLRTTGTPEQQRARAEGYARRHAVMVECAAIRRETDAKISELHQAALQLQIGLAESRNAFSGLLNAYQQGEEQGMARLLHGNIGKEKKRGNTRTAAPLVVEAYKNPNISIIQAVEQTNAKLVADGHRPISYSTAKRTILSQPVRNSVAQAKYSKQRYYADHKPYINFAKPDYVGDEAELDGLVAPHLCYDPTTGEELRPSIVMFRDKKSGMVTGFQLSPTENRYAIIKCLHNHTKAHGYLPVTIFFDKHSAQQTAEYGNIEERLAGFNCQIVSRAHDPHMKGGLERFNRTFKNRFLNTIPGYSARPFANSAVEELNRDARDDYYKKHGPYSMDRYAAIIAEKIEQYNNTSFDGKPTPKEVFKDCTKPNAAKLHCLEIASLFMLKTSVKVDRNMINLTVNKTRYSYDFLHTGYGGMRAEVYYASEDMDRVFVEIKSEGFADWVEREAIKRNDMKTIGAKSRLQRAEIDRFFDTYSSGSTPKDEFNEMELGKLIEEIGYGLGGLNTKRNP